LPLGLTDLVLEEAGLNERHSNASELLFDHNSGWMPATAPTAGDQNPLSQ